MHVSSGIPTLRRQQISERLTRGEAVNAVTLAEEYGISEDAIRRDLRALAAEGVCKRVYGGALPLSPASSPIAVRAGEDIERKRALARTAAKLIHSGQTLFLDTGSTNLELAEVLPRDRALTIVTNSVPVAAKLMDQPGITLIVIGGKVNPTVGGCIDARSIAELQHFRIDLCFLGACAMSLEHGMAGFDIADVDFKRSLLAVSEATALMLTNTKLETAAPYRIGAVADIDHLVLEHDAPASILDALRRAKVSLTTADLI